jgi:hypothetical protein
MVLLQINYSSAKSSSVIPIDIDSRRAINKPFAICHGFGHNPTEAQNLSNQGVQMSRNDITWSAIEQNHGVYDFTHYDRFFSNLTAVGIEPLPILDYGNPVLFGIEYNVYIAPEQIPAWLAFVNTTVRRYQGIITYWEIWNEPNLDGFWSGTDAEFFNILNLTANLIKSIDPTLHVVSPGISGHSPDYLDAMISYIGDDQFNALFSALAFHPYSGRTAELITEKCGAVRQVTEKHGFMGEIWITEVGLSTQASSIEKAEEEWPAIWDYQATQVIKIFSQAIAENISRIVWYCYRDGDNKTYGEANFGIQHYGEEGWFYKPAGYAYQTLSRLLSDGFYLPAAYELSMKIGIQSDLIWIYHFQTARNTSVLVFWSQSLAERFQISILGNTQPYSLTNYDYFTNNTEISNHNSHIFKNGAVPTVIELDYTQIQTDQEQNGIPLIIQIQVSYSLNYSILLVIIPIIAILGLSFIFLQYSRQRSVK